jgi:hypothetical protein
MGLLDSIKEKLAPHGDKAAKGVDKASEMADDKTGGTYSGQIDAASEKAKEAMGVQADEAPPAAEQAPPAEQRPPQENPPA